MHLRRAIRFRPRSSFGRRGRRRRAVRGGTDGTVKGLPVLRGKVQKGLAKEK